MRYRSLIFIVFAFLLSSCVGSLMRTADDADMVKVLGRTTPFSDKYVDSKAGKNDAETQINNLGMFLFNTSGTCVSYQYRETSRPVFTINRTDYSVYDMTEAVIILVANAGDMTGKVDDVGDLRAYSQSVSGIGVPSGGFPMAGHIMVDLTPGKELPSDLLEIPLINLFAKIAFTINIRADQQGEGYFTPQFNLLSWTVYNAPTSVSFGDVSGETPNARQSKQAPVTSQTVIGSNPISQSNSMSFSFYVPEHYLTPSADYSYPVGIKDADRQKYKPCLVADGETPIYVRLEGNVTDHQGHAKKMTYDVYLGGNNYNDFNIRRNTQYNNSITIKGTTNSKNPGGWGGDNVSVDHRVSIEKDVFTLYVERETHLDSHYEVRPIDVEFEKAGVDYTDAWVRLVVLNNDGSDPDEEPGKAQPTWIRFENMNDIDVSSDAYCANGKRKYFTTDLVTTTLAGNSSSEIKYTDEERRIWVYFDENVTQGDGHRMATIRAKYYHTDGQTTPDKVFDFKFRQRNLYPVSYDSRNYLIEYYEEYLYNFDPKDPHGNTDYEGMAWGLSDITESISHEVPAFNYTGGGEGIVNWLLSNAKPYYDFYITQAECAKPTDGVEGEDYFPHAGLRFTNKIVDRTGIGPLTLAEQPSSAVEYCYNKNKRNSDGTISDIKWYLPAIDEIEDIVSGGYKVFKEFQEQFYWSSQPAFIVKEWNYEAILVRGSGSLYQENLEYARATSVEYKGKDPITGQEIYDSVPSLDHEATRRISYFLIGSWSGEEDILDDNGAPKQPVRDLGYQPKTEKNRIRCVYKP